MAQILYGTATPGGKAVAESLFNLLKAIDEVRHTAEWIEEVGPANLVASTDFLVSSGNGQAFNDTYLALDVALQAFLTANSNANTNRIASLYKGG